MTLLLTSITAIGIKTTNQETGYTTIIIDGNDQFTSENGVISGAGHIGYPYIIQFDEAIDSLTIKNTDKLFIVQNSIINWDIEFTSVSDGTIKNCEFTGENSDIYLCCTNNMVIQDLSTLVEIHIDYSDYVIIHDLKLNGELSENDVGIDLFDSTNCEVYNCDITGGISEYEISGLRIENLAYVDPDPRNIIHNCNISNFDNGILVSSDRNTIYNCNVHDCVIGIHLWASNQNIIYHNNFYDNQNNAKGEDFPLDWNFLYKDKSGNYWDDYDEPCELAFDSDGDGIIDLPYIISDHNMDCYPLAKKYTGGKIKTKENTMNKEFNNILSYLFEQFPLLTRLLKL